MAYLAHNNRPKSDIAKSIAVLPFLNMSSDPQQAFFADGMMDEILNHLYKIGGLKVVSRTSSLIYKGRVKNSTEIARELGVGNLLEGSVQRDGDSIRIIVQLINGSADDHIWAETYVRKFKDIFSIQSDIAQQIALSLKVKIDPSVKERIESEPTKNTEAYSLYLKAQEQGFDSKQSKLQLEAAIRLDSTFANAYVGLAYYWLFNGGYNHDLSSKEVLMNADPLLKKAIQLNPDQVDAHVANAYMALLYEWDFAKVEKEYNIVQRLSPSNPENSGLLSLYLLADGRPTEALNIYLKSFKLDSTQGMGPAALIYFFNGNSKKALDLINMNRHTIGTDESIWSDYIKVVVFAEDFSNAIQAFEKYRKLYGPNINSLVLGYTGIAYYKTGQKDSAENYLNILKTRAQQSSVGSPSYFLAGLYTAMGDQNKAIQSLQKAYADREVEMYWLKVEPPFRPLHNDPRFKELVDKIGSK
jgi:TolB-like protein